MDKINFDLVGNNRDLIKKIEEAQSAFVSLGKTAEEQARRIDTAFGDISFESVRRLRLALLGIPGELQGFNSIRKLLSELDRHLGQIEKDLSQMGPSARKSVTGLSSAASLVSTAFGAVGDKIGAMNVAGKASIPIWRQVTSSLFSWHTGLKVGVTLFSLYGEKLFSWLGNIFKADAAQRSINKIQQELNETLLNSSNVYGNQVVQVKSLQEQWNDLGNNLGAKKRFIEENKLAFEDLGVSVSSIKDAENLLVNNTPVFIEALKLRAQAAAAGKLASGKYEEAMILRNKANLEADKEYGFFEKQGNYFKAVWRGIVGKDSDLSLETRMATQQQENVKALTNEAAEAEALADTYFDLSQAKELAAASLLKDKGIKGTTSEVFSSNDILRQQTLLAEAIRKGTEERKDAEIATEVELLQEKIDLMNEGSEKVIAQIHLNYDKRFLAIQKEERALLQKRQKEERMQWEKDNPEWEKEGMIFTPRTTALQGKDATNISLKYSNAYEKQQKELDAYAAAEKAALNELLAQYGTYVEKRQAIIDMAEEKKRGKSAREQEIIDRQTQKSLAGLQQEVEKETDVFGKLFTDMKNRSVKDVKAITERAEEALAFVKGGEWNEEQGIKLGVSKEAFDYLQKTPEEVEKIGKALTGASEGTEKLDSVFSKMGAGFEKVFSSGSDPTELKKGLAEIEGAMNELMGAGKLLSNSFSSLGNAFGNDALKGIAEGMNVVMDAASATMDGAKAGAVFGPWGAAAGAAIGLATSLASSIAKIHDAKNEKRIKRLQEQIDTLERSYKNLGKAVDKAYSADASKLIGQQNEMLEQQKVLIQNQIKEEESKKDSNNDRIKEWQNQLEDIDAVIAENKEKAKDAIFGEDLKSAIDEFAQAYADAWAAGDDKAKSSKDFVKNMIKQMIVEAIKAASSKPMEELRDKLNGFFSDGIISNWEREQIERDAEKIMRDLDRQFAWADQYMKGDEPEEKPAREASQQGIAQASQESVDKLDGVMTGIQGHTYSIDENVRAILSVMTGEGATSVLSGTEKAATGYEPKVVSLADIDKNMSSMIGLQNMAVSHLSKIERNTDRLEAIELSMGQIKNGIDTLNTKGITLKR